MGMNRVNLLKRHTSNHPSLSKQRLDLGVELGRLGKDRVKGANGKIESKMVKEGLGMGVGGGLDEIGMSVAGRRAAAWKKRIQYNIPRQIKVVSYWDAQQSHCLVFRASLIELYCRCNDERSS
ncbi:hypothetical protein M0804_009213 [Polistes exclamans]|nr:hypothetical protein M0804_009213 [Polistes exclamans]